jgi:hypothetical protein
MALFCDDQEGHWTEESHQPRPSRASAETCLATTTALCRRCRCGATARVDHKRNGSFAR